MSVGLTPAAVEREHQLAGQTLAQRMVGHQQFQLRYELGVASKREVRFDPPLDRCDA